MKFPKNRANLYLVLRRNGRVNIGGFANYEDAVDYADASRQEWWDKTGQDELFDVELTTFYG